MGAVAATRAVQEASKDEVAFPKTVVAVAIRLVEEEGVWPQEAVGSLRLLDLLKQVASIGEGTSHVFHNLWSLTLWAFYHLLPCLDLSGSPTEPTQPKLTNFHVTSLMRTGKVLKIPDIRSRYEEA